ncbi:MAG: citrate synthase [Deltaproteobacteria bacterium]|nr:citrate synthase [Deltaproteobacteria bacterium]
MPEDTLTIIDNRTGKKYTVAIKDGTVRAADLAQIKNDADSPGLMSYDPAFGNTAACRSAITYIDGDRGILRYRGYPIEQLAEKSTFLEVAYLVMNGELPAGAQLKAFTHNITTHTILHENIKQFIDGFHYDAHPMGILVSSVGALSTFYPDAKRIFDDDSRKTQAHRLIAKMPTLAAFAYRHSVGMPYAYPDNDLSYAGNFLNMLFKKTELKYTPNPVIERALDVLFILHADHEQNCSTNAMRCVGSSHADPFSAVAAATAALYGPLHGGANEAVVRMLQEIGGVANIPAYIKRVKAGEVRLMGFGHRIYKNYDPRAKIIKRIADEVLEVTGRNPLLDIAVELERIALADEYFVSRKLYPNVDFYSGIIYQAMSFPTDMFPVLFAIGRTPGWIAQWTEMLLDDEQRIARPRQVYTGHAVRDYVPLERRS